MDQVLAEDNGSYPAIMFNILQAMLPSITRKWSSRIQLAQCGINMAGAHKAC